MAADARHGNYQLVCDNCVDFTNEVLRRGGQGDWSIANHLRDGTLADRYAQIAREICTNPFVNIPSSGLSNFMSAEGLALAQEFLDTLEPFNHPEWFQGLDDPDDWADELFAKAYRIGKRLGLEDGDFTALADMVNSGMGSPIVIDMNGDGISTSHMLTSEVLFDIDGDGDQDKTGWITGEDAFVAWDRNKDGLINDVSELFGGLQRGQGYAELAALDCNADGVLNALDETYAQLELWQDRNANGITDQGELQDLVNSNVFELYVHYTSQEVWDHGNLLGEVSSAQVDGSARLVADVYFRYTEASTPQAHSVISAMAAFTAPTIGESLQPSPPLPVAPMTLAC